MCDKCNVSESGESCFACHGDTGNHDKTFISQTVTHEMLQAAVKEAVRLGMLPKYASEDNYVKNWGNIEKILIAAMEASNDENN